MARSFAVIAAAVFLIAGCGSVFTHPMKDQKNLAREFDRDRKDCERYVATHPRDPNATCKAPQPTMTEESKEGLYSAVLSDDDGRCATCDEVKRCLVEQKGWKRVK